MHLHGPIKIDLHMHSSVSDGTDRPEEILARAEEAPLRIFSLTDHDAIAGCQEIRIRMGLTAQSRREEEEAAGHKGSLVSLAPGSLRVGRTYFLNGVEFSCREGEIKYHILGYGYNPENLALRAVVNKGHHMRAEKLELRLAFLRESFGITFSEEDIAGLRALHNPAKPHLAKLLIRDGYASSIAEAFENYLNKKKFPSIYVDPEEAMEAILAAGAVPVLAHPHTGDGNQWVEGEELERRVKHLIKRGLQGLEVFYYGLDRPQTREVLDLAERYDLFVTAGSDYHGGNKQVPFGAAPLPVFATEEELQEQFPRLWRFLQRVLPED